MTKVIFMHMPIQKYLLQLFCLVFASGSIASLPAQALANPAILVPGNPAANASMLAAQTAMRNAELRRQMLQFAADPLVQAYKKDTQQVINELCEEMEEFDLEALAIDMKILRKALLKERKQKLEAARGNMLEQKAVLEHCRSEQQNFLKRSRLEEVLGLYERMQKRLSDIYEHYTQAGLNLKRYHRLTVIENQADRDLLHLELASVQEELAALEAALRKREEQILEGKYNSLGGLIRRFIDGWGQLGVVSQPQAAAI